MSRTLLWNLVLLAACAYFAYRLSTGGMGYAYVSELGGVESTATAVDALTGSAQFSLSRTVGVWVAALGTLCIFSFLYRDNPCYKLAESVLVGVSAAYWMIVGFWTVIVPNLLGILFPEWIQSWAMPGLSPVRSDDWYLWILPLVLGVMLLWRLSPKGAWIARWPLAFIIGTTAGLRLVAFIQADFLSQIRNSIVPLIVAKGSSTDGVAESAGMGELLGRIDVGASFSNIVLVLGILVCLVYFFFSFEHKGLVGKVSRAGVWVLMITFGAGFGFTVMGRIALLAIRMEFLFDDWLWLIDPTGRRLGM